MNADKTRAPREYFVILTIEGPCEEGGDAAFTAACVLGLDTGATAQEVYEAILGRLCDHTGITRGAHRVIFYSCTPNG